MITLFPPSYGLPIDTLSDILKSPQNFILQSILPENQGSFLFTQDGGLVVIVVFKPSKTTLPTHVVFV